MTSNLVLRAVAGDGCWIEGTGLLASGMRTVRADFGVGGEPLNRVKILIDTVDVGGPVRVRLLPGSDGAWLARGVLRPVGARWQRREKVP